MVVFQTCRKAPNPEWLELRNMTDSSPNKLIAEEEKYIPIVGSEVMAK